MPTTFLELELCGGKTRVVFGVDQDSWFVCTTFSDGTFVMARPRPRERNWVWQHDVLHSLLADHLGWEHSPTLWRLAHGADPDRASDRLVAHEEAAVLRLQKVLLSS